MDFDTGEKEVLCFPCRYPIIKSRVGCGDDEDSEDECIEGKTGQMGLEDF
jgi:hypothetical protein